MSLTYTNYLKIDELLDLQELKSRPEEHDEMLFIVIHQTYELWFKQILHEFERVRNEMSAGHTWTSVKTWQRILKIMKTLVAQIDILETMTPLEFSSFRGFLDQASGFQSVQFREIEILCGLRSKIMLSAHEDHPEHFQHIKQRMKEPTLWECFCKFLQKQGYDIPNPERVNGEGLLYDPSPKIQDTIVQIMNTHQEAALLAELLVDFDEGLQEWRYRHVKMVERTIGTKKGTGGSDGVEYLKTTLSPPIFPDLWEVRTQL